MGHAPSQCRQILRQLKEARRDPADLMAEAREIDDPGYAAMAVMAVSGDRRLPWNEARQGLELAVRLAREIDHLGRRGEIWADLLARGADWRPGARNPQAPKLRHHVLDAAVADILTMPDGQWTLDAIRLIAALAGPSGRTHLLQRALSNRGFEAEGAKAVLRAADAAERQQLRPMIDGLQPQLKANLLGFLATRGEASTRGPVKAAWAIEDPPKRREALRVLAYQAPDIRSLGELVASTAGREPADAFHVQCAAAAAADKMGDRDSCRNWLDVAAGTVAHIADDKGRAKAERKLAQARERAGLESAKTEPATAPPAEPEPQPAPAASPHSAPASAAVPSHAPSRRHVLALVDTYEGGLKPVHLRAVARAAPLCAAFNLDLALIGFPTEDLESLAMAAARETAIGAGGRHVQELLQQGRLHLVASSGRVPDWGPLGTPVASTPQPQADKRLDLADVPGRICLLMGLGRQGLPASFLDVAHHYEITGADVSLETATAMGILADRLGAQASP